jgi:hypothetical protein
VLLTANFGQPVRNRLAPILLLVVLVASGCSSSSAPPTTLVPDSQLIGNPAPFPAGDADKAAAALADSIAHGGSKAMPSLLAAIQGSGFGIRDLAVGGQIVVKPSAPSQGLAFQAGEVYTMGKLLDRGYAVSLADVASLVQNLDSTTFGAAPVKDLLVAGLRTAAMGSMPTQRLWARLIVELGTRAQVPYDLMTVAPDDAQLNIVQTQFILLRLFGDLYARVQPDAAAGPSASASPSASAAGVAPSAARAELVADTKPLCNPGDREAEILDATAVGAAFGFEKILDAAEEMIRGHTLHHYADAIPWVNAALALIKFIATAAAFTGTLAADPDPLTRTKTTMPGDLGELKLTVSVDSDESPFVNCLRLLFNGAGLDFNLPKGGAVEEAEITWTLLQGGGFVELCPQPCTGASGSVGTGENNARTGHTDKDGVATLGVRGVKQTHNLPTTVTSVERRAVVRAGVNLKPAKLFRDLTDAAGAAGAGGAGVVIFSGELLLRVGFFGAGAGFKVIDWGEHWKVDATLHIVGQDGTGNIDYKWIGTADVDGDGVITGTGTGLLSGNPGCVTSGGVVFSTLSGTYGVEFGGTKKGTHFNLSIKGTAPSIQLGTFGGAISIDIPCDAFHEQQLNLLTATAINPASAFGGVTVFSFEAAVGGQGSGSFGLGGAANATITIRTTQLPQV